MDNLKRKLKIGLALVLCLSLAACTQAQILTDLEIAAAAAAAVAAVPGIPPTISTDISLAVTALDCVSVAIETGGTAVTVSTSVAACGLKTVATVFPVGTPQVVIATLTALNSAIASVLKDQVMITAEIVEPATVQPATFTPMVQSFAGSSTSAKDKKFSLGMGGKTKVKKIRKTLADAKAKLPKK
jgi:hypothetical protein